MSRTTSWVRSRSRWALAAGLVGTAALALTTTAALGGFTASITNNANSASTGSLVMQEVVGTTTCLSTGTGTTTSATVNATNANTTCPANKYGAQTSAVPGGTPVSTNVVITDVGSVAASTLAMNVGGCVATSNPLTTYNGNDTSGFCSKVDVTIEDDTTTARCVYPAGAGACPTPSNTYNLTTLATAYGTAASILPASTTVAAGTSRTYKVTVGVDGTAATNADQGLTATQPITFTFGQ